MALKFNGTTDRALIPLPQMAGKNVAAWSFWLYWDAYANDDDLAMEWTADTNTNPGMYVNPNGSLGTFDSAYSSGASSFNKRYDRAAAPVAQWNHIFVSVSYQDPSSTVWINGVMLTPTGTSGVAPSTSTVYTGDTLYLMHRGNGPSLFAAGRMAELAIWAGYGNAGYLNADVAQALYRGRSPFDVNTHHPLIGYFPLDNVYSGLRNRVRYGFNPVAIVSGTSPIPSNLPTNLSTVGKTSYMFGAASGDGGSGIDYVDADTVPLDITPSHCEIFIRPAPSEFIFSEWTVWSQQAGTKWEQRATTKWQWDAQPVQGEYEEICL